MLTLADLQHLVDKDLPLELLLERRGHDREGAFPLIAGIVTGVLVGAAVAILFTPRPGREIRSRLASRAVEPVEHIVERASSAGEQAREQVERLSTAARTRMQSAVHRRPAPERAEERPLDIIAGEPAPHAERQGLLARLKRRWQEAVEAGKEAARERAAEERARYREMSHRPDALREAEGPEEGA